METKIRTKIITANGFQYEIGDESNPFDSVAKIGDYTLSCMGKVFKYDSQPVLWLNGCPKIVASNDPELKDVLPVLPQYDDVSQFGVIENLKIKKQWIERERKFKLKFMPKDTAPALVIRQAYLILSDGKQLRVRITQTDDITVSYICYKASVSGSQTDRNEFEYQIPNEDAFELFNSTDLQVNKIRYSKSLGFSHADIDIYPDGLEIVEIETPENVTLNELPDFCGEEITGIKEYSNIYLALQNKGK